MLLAALAGIVAGSELVVRSAEVLIAVLGLSETVFGMTILALPLSIEELARELPAARRGRADISFGNVAGPILTFSLLNAGIIALVRPVPVDGEVLRSYLPVCLVTVAIITVFMVRKRVSRRAGAVLVLLYGISSPGPMSGLSSGGARSRGGRGVYEKRRAGARARCALPGQISGATAWYQENHAAQGRLRQLV